MSIGIRYVRWWLTAIVTASLVACGGGGGGDGNGAGGGTAVAPPVIATPPATVTVSREAIAFDHRTLSTPVVESVDATVSDASVAVVTAGPAPDAAPVPWLESTVTGSGTRYAVQLRLRDEVLPAGSGTATVRVTAYRADRTAIAFHDVTVSYRLPGLLTVASQATREVRYEGLDTPSTETYSIAAEDLAWTVSADVPWLAIYTATGTGSRSIAVGVQATTRLPPGTYTGTVTVRASDGQVATRAVQLEQRHVTYAVAPTALAFSGTNGVPIAVQTLTLATTDLDPAPTLDLVGVASVASSAPWLRVSPVNGGIIPAGTTYQVSVDPTIGPLASGSYDATLTFTIVAGSSTTTLTIPVTLALVRPVLTVQPAALTLGGPLGREATTREFAVTLGTGSVLYPFTVSSPGSFATRQPTTSYVSSSPVLVTVSGDATLSPGSRSGSIVVSTTVNGEVIARTVPVTYNLDAHRIVPSTTGVAFVSTPSVSRLTRQIHMTDNFGRATTYTATADQPWLGISPRLADIAQDLTLTVDPTNLPSDQLQTATVTVVGASVETIQVAYWKSSSDARRTAIVGRYTRVKADPIRPFFYAHADGAEIVAFNALTGAEAFRLSNLGVRLGAMDVSPDGSRLFVIDQATQHLVAVDLVTRARAFDIALTSASTPAATTALRVATVNGVRLVVTSGGQAYRASDGGLVSDPRGTSLFRRSTAYLLDVSRDGRTLAAIDTAIDPITLEQHTLDYSEAVSPHLIVGPDTGRDGALLVNQPGDGRDIGFSADGSLLYLATAGPATLSAYTVGELAPVRSLLVPVLPAAFEVAVDGRLVVAATTAAVAQNDFAVYSAAGGLLYSTRVGAPGNGIVAPGQLAVTGDGIVAAVVAPHPASNSTPTDTSIEIVPIAP